MREFQLYGLGNALVDIFIDLSDEELAPLGFEKGSMRLVEADEQRGLLGRFQSREPRLVSGGSVANSTIAFALLGGVRGAGVRRRLLRGAGPDRPAVLQRLGGPRRDRGGERRGGVRAPAGRGALGGGDRRGQRRLRPPRRRRGARAGVPVPAGG